MSSRRTTAVAAIATIARALEEVHPRIVFVGGIVTALYPLENGVDVRPTVDVDCVVDVATTVAYYAFVANARARGFQDCIDEHAPICRLVYEEIRVDIVATVDIAIGATNRWYRDAIKAAARYTVEPGLDVLAITPIYFVATKLEAFGGRGGGDYQASHDLEDVFAVIAGLLALRDQISKDTTRVAAYVREELVRLRTIEAFIDAIPGHFEGDAAGQSRATMVLEWLNRLAQSPMR